MIEILDILDLRIAEFRSLRDNKLDKMGVIVAESEKVVLKLLKGNFSVIKYLTTPDFYYAHQNLIDHKGGEVFVASRDVMSNIVGLKLHHGIMALTPRPKNVDLKLLGPKILAFNGLTSPENVGAIVRSACAFGVNSIIVDKKTCSPFLRRCVRVSMGNIFNMKVHFSENLSLSLDALKLCHYNIISTANIPGSVALKDYFFTEKVCLIIGSEGHGIERNILEFSDHILKIPIDGEVGHLNAAQASAIFLYQLSQTI